MNRRSLTTLALAALLLGGCAGETLFYAAPVLLPRTDVSMRTAGFWIGQHPCPDRVIMDAAAIRAFNRDLCRRGLTTDIVSLPDSLPAGPTAQAIREDLSCLDNRTLYFSDGRAVDHLFVEEINRAVNPVATETEQPVRLALTIRRTDQRLAPTARKLYASRGNRSFDEMQNTFLDIATPLAVARVSADAAWYYTYAPSSRGWVAAADTVPCTRRQIEEYLAATPYAVVVRPRTRLFLDEKCRRPDAAVQMGMRLPITRRITGKHLIGDDVVEVRLPVRGPDGGCVFTPAYVECDNVHEGFLPYTPRTIISQAFALLDSPYGWGGAYDEQDCSGLVQEVFAVTGLQLPRNSREQAQSGVEAAALTREMPRDNRVAALGKNGLGGITLLCMKGHVMLYLGVIQGDVYAIHALWAYTEPTWHGDQLRLVNRIVVSDLDLGEGASRGSLLERLTTVRLVSDHLD